VGFTKHEHLDDTYLIHMNGRVYDYRLGRFLSVDPIISNPANSQSINPYSYIGNNPLSGVDPTGYCPTGKSEVTGSHVCYPTEDLGKPLLLNVSLGTNVIYVDNGATKQTSNSSSATPSAREGNPEQTANQKPDSWFRFTEPGVAYKTSRYSVMPTVGYYDSGSAILNLPINLLHTAYNLMSIPVNATTELLSLPEQLIRATGGTDNDVAAFNFAMMMTGISELNALRSAPANVTKGLAGEIGEQHVFWSGGRVAEDAARAFANANNGIILGDTTAGRALAQSTAGVAWSEARSQWLSISQDFARSASGEVNVFQNARGISVDSIWRNEYQVLIQNPNVTRINYNVVMPNGSIVTVP
jgi:RHS repeat-associated protein